MMFADIPGQGALKNALIQALERKKMAHAQLFAGRDGGVALPLTLAYAQYILCERPTSTDSCGKCRNCVRVQKGIHPDIHYFFPKVSVSKESEYEKKLPEFLESFRSFMTGSPFGLFDDYTRKAGFENKNLLISKEDSRRMIRSVSMKSVEGGTKIILIWLPEYFHPSAANAILKVLEEPPAQTIYLLVTYAYESLLSTVTSRTLLHVVSPSSDEEIARYLVEKRQLDEAKALEIAKLAYGSIGTALEFISETDDQAYEDFRFWMLECLGSKYGELMKRAEKFGKSGRLSQRSTIQFALNVLRETVVADEEKLSTRHGSEANFITKFNDFLGMSARELMSHELNSALVHLERNANAKMVHFHLSSRFSQLLVK